MENKTIVITGGSRGIGKTVAETYRQRKANIVIGDIRDAEGEKLVAKMNEEAGAKVAIYVHTDVSHYEDNRHLFRTAESEFNRVDVAFLNAGIGSTSNTLFAPLDDDREESIFNVDLIGVVKGTKVALLHMAKNKEDSAIIINASTCSFQTPPAMSAYNAAKHGVIGWVRSLDFLPKVCNVRINANTDLMTDLGDRSIEPYWKVADALPRASMKTLIQAIDICIKNTTKSGAAILVLPDGVSDFPRPAVFESTVNEATNKALEIYKVEMVEQYKKELDIALKRYSDN
ncbi:uncharacterized protein BX664DRAFT_382573 [Halteromyces radiatus]|uniref:uncharacterized protein n=1 Tax=Halteromyces radiatus TaxID=101107 RepID=UPI00221F2856|nr:uncharacterized protein BX664DRAFT_382573 [Halteromyces radiatus]KAI8100140.1 hypothetical protein BX664DRAFT_382573 [Halteromyces radiatus]